MVLNIPHSKPQFTHGTQFFAKEKKIQLVETHSITRNLSHTLVFYHKMNVYKPIFLCCYYYFFKFRQALSKRSSDVIED